MSNLIVMTFPNRDEAGQVRRTLRHTTLDPGVEAELRHALQ